MSDTHTHTSNQNPLPVYLFADSQLLFLQNKQGDYFFQRELQQQHVTVKKAVYIGAANGDNPVFFELFQAAMQHLGKPHCQFLSHDSNLAQATALLRQADLILLAGGDVKRGWQFIGPLTTVLTQCYRQGAVLVGISAGAMHLGALAWLDKEQLCQSDLYATTGQVRCIVAVHDEENHWQQLRQVMAMTQGCFTGFGIVKSAGVAAHYNGYIRPLHKPLVCFHYDHTVKQSCLPVGARYLLDSH